MHFKNTTLSRIACIACLTAGCLSVAAAPSEQGKQSTVADPLMATWDAELLARATYPLQDSQRTNWSNLPANLLKQPRPGVRMGDLAPQDRQAVFDFLEASLSASGYSLIRNIVQADDELSHEPRAKRFGWTSDNYWFALFGQPSNTQPWAWQFGGHHLAIHGTLADGRLHLSPLFLGIEPAMFEHNGHEVRPMDQILIASQELVSNLSADQLKATLIENRPREVHAGPGQDGVTPPEEGAQVSTWTDAQRKQFLHLIQQWIGILPEASAEQRMNEVKVDLMNFRFAWHGAIDGSTPIYLRIQSQDLLIEFSTETAVGAEASAGHYHSVVRDLRNDYGERVITETSPSAHTTQP